MSADLSSARRQAWETRRAKYGERGHAGSYDRGGMKSARDGALALVVRLHVEGVLSEGQVCAATGLGRVELRALADAAQSSTETQISRILREARQAPKERVRKGFITKEPTP